MTLLFLKRLNDTFEENEEKVIQADRNLAGTSEVVAVSVDIIIL